jgi:phosphoglycolate phosphatase
MQRAEPTRLLIFDFDGTLADTLDDVVWCMRDTFEEFGLPLPDRQAVASTVGLTLEQSIVRLAGSAVSVDSVAPFVELYRRRYQASSGSRTVLYPGVKEFLESLAQADVTSVVVSNKGFEAIRSTLARLGIVDSFAQIFAGDTTTYKKPDPRLFEREIRPRFADIAPDEMMVVGDTETDLRWAANSGLRFCWAAYGYGSSEDCAAIAGGSVISSIEDLWDQLRAPCPSAGGEPSV